MIHRFVKNSFEFSAQFYSCNGAVYAKQWISFISTSSKCSIPPSETIRYPGVAKYGKEFFFDLKEFHLSASINLLDYDRVILGSVTLLTD